MRYLALATDYDGTLAAHGKVTESTLQALQRVRLSGRKLLMVTGRHLPDLKSVFSRLDLFDLVVAENGALLYWPATGDEKLLCDPPDARFIKLLEQKGVPFTVGKGIVATCEPHQIAVLDCIRDLGLELHVIFNKGSVMVLPSGVNKASGMLAALKNLGLSAHSVVGIGDAENDHAFLTECGCAVAVANALSTLKERADVVTQGKQGQGVEELIGQLLEDDLARYSGKARSRRAAHVDG